MTDNTSKSKFEIIVDLIKALLWPLLVMTIFIQFYDQIYSIIEVIPTKFRQSSSFKIGSISFEIKESAKAKGNEELAAIIQDLSRDAIRTLISLGKSTHSVVIRDDMNKIYELRPDINFYKELEANGLLEANEKIKQFEDFYLLLDLKKEIVYRENYYGDSYSTNWSIQNKYPVVRLFVQRDRINDEQHKRLMGFQVKLTKKGLDAFDIIVEVVSELVNRNKE